MPILAVLVILVQVVLAIHVVRTGRQLYWIMIIVMIPMIGSIVYFVAEVLPELRHSPTARRAVRNVRQTLDPAREKKRIEAQLAVADTVQNRIALARECLALGDMLNAEELFASCLKGPHATDPDIMLGLAQAQFGRGDAAAARKTLEALIAANPSFRSSDGHLLYARSLEGMGDHDKAVLEYQVLATSYPGEEARARYGLLLKRLDRGAEAQKLFAEVLARAKISPGYYKRENREWIELAREQSRA